MSVLTVDPHHNGHSFRRSPIFRTSNQNFFGDKFDFLPPQRSCGKVMFLHLCVILFTEGRSLYRGVSAWGDLCPGRSLSRGSLSWGVSVQGGSLSRRVHVQGGLCLEGGLCQAPYGNERAVRILLECIFVSTTFVPLFICFISSPNRLKLIYRSGTVNSNTVNSKFHLIRSYWEIFFYHFPNISCLECTVNSNFHLIRSKTLLTNDFELTVPNL